ncbi:MAG: hypothetical protein ACRDGI_06235 [Candidatus Limnocylindrales bacterium]
MVATALGIALLAVIGVGVAQRPAEASPGPSPPPARGLSTLTPGPPTTLALVPTVSTGAIASLPVASNPTTPPTRAPTPRPSAKPAACKPTDQDRYVYNPTRLAVQAACIRVTGTVAAIRHEADGDLHILLALDPAYRHLLKPANQGEELGDLVVEPVCVRSISQGDAKATCAADPDPYPGTFPAIGSHIWMEGRYVFDTEHGDWAELHPLYRWGPL